MRQENGPNAVINEEHRARRPRVALAGTISLLKTCTVTSSPPSFLTMTQQYRTEFAHLISLSTRQRAVLDLLSPRRQRELVKPVMLSVRQRPTLELVDHRPC